MIYLSADTITVDQKNLYQICIFDKRIYD